MVIVFLQLCLDHHRQDLRSFPTRRSSDLYPTAGCDSASEAQPFYVNAPYGICIAHNGNLTNATELAEVITREDRRHLNTTSDSEVLLNVFASELQRIGTPRVTAGDVFAALNAVYRRCRGGYAVVAMIIGH